MVDLYLWLQNAQPEPFLKNELEGICICILLFINSSFEVIGILHKSSRESKSLYGSNPLILNFSCIFPYLPH